MWLTRQGSKITRMNYYGAKELAEAFRTVRKNTLVVAEEIDEKNYGFRAAPETRTVAQTLIHIADAPKLQEHVHAVAKLKTLEGFDFMGFFAPMMNQEQLPHTKLQILTLLNEQGEHFAHWLGSLSDSFLGEQVSMPAGMTPASKSRFEMILGVKEHEMHHRAQLMLMQRMTGGVPHLTRQMNERMAAMMKAKA
jgi:uncharacterized damage-inducible protein DinB